MNEIAILMLTHNAARYVRTSVNSIFKNTQLDDTFDYSLNVLDNNSNWYTKFVIRKLKSENKINSVSFQEENLFFAKGNNLAFDEFSRDSKYILLLNSDIKVQSTDWLQILVDQLEQNESIGAVAYGAVMEKPVRADGYAMLVRTQLYEKFRLEEKFQWWWGVTKLEAQILNDGFEVLAFKNHNDKLIHYGGKSGKAWKNSTGTGMDIDEATTWFSRGVQIIENIENK